MSTKQGTTKEELLNLNFAEPGEVKNLETPVSLCLWEFEKQVS